MKSIFIFTREAHLIPDNARGVIFWNGTGDRSVACRRTINGQGQSNRSSRLAFSRKERRIGPSCCARGILWFSNWNITYKGLLIGMDERMEVLECPSITELGAFTENG